MKTMISPSEQIMVDAASAAALCSVSRSTWLSWDATGQCPRAIRLNGRVLWCVDTIRRWAQTGCPSRETLEVRHG